MRKLIFAINITPDGFCDHTAVVADNTLHQFYLDLLTDVDTIIFGRRTFQLFESRWPSVARTKEGDPVEVKFAQEITAREKIVISHHSISTYWLNTKVLKNFSKDSINEVKLREGKDILALGSPRIAEQLSNLGLIDLYYFVVQPMMAGKGRRLFEDTKNNARSKLQLVETKAFSSGAIVLCYKR